jgi:hypothetical protein
MYLFGRSSGRAMLAAIAAITMGVWAGSTAAPEPATHFERRKHPVTHAPQRFRTNRVSNVVLPLPHEKDAFVFAVFGDRTGGPKEGVKVLAQAVKDVNLFEPDLVMTVGDLVEGLNPTPQWIEQMTEYKGIMADLLCPWFPVAGNHDVWWAHNSPSPPGGHEREYEMFFGPLWYAFKHKDCWFIALYSDEDDPQTGRKGSHRMSDEQFQWLRETLHEAREARHVFVFLHHPRWIGEAPYGDAWEPVHKLLAESGNVRIVFAGHIHNMRYDGPRDGIEYVTLATVGGAQSGVVPRAGYIHHYNLVTVRKDQIALAALPVGQVIDPRTITEQVSHEAARLSHATPLVDPIVELGSDGSADQVLHCRVLNPVTQPMEFVIRLESGDSRWSVSPDHAHGRIEGGETKEIRFNISRRAASLDDTFRPLELVLDVDYLAQGLRYPIPTTRLPVAVRPQIAPPAADGADTALLVDGLSYARVAGRLLHDDNAPFTVECAFNADRLTGWQTLVSRSAIEIYAHHGLFLIDGVPTFTLLLEGRSYVRVAGGASRVKAGQWHHIAGVWDGREARLYLDGELVGRAGASGPRPVNELPLSIGAHIDRGAGRFFFKGSIDAVRITEAALYNDQRVPLRRRPAVEPRTRLLLNMDGLSQGWLFNEAPAAHAELVGSASLGQASD